MPRFKIHGKSGDQNWKRHIEESDVFVALITKYWVQEPERIQEIEYAKSIGKKLIVAVFDGIDPEPYLKNGNVLVKRVFDRQEVESRMPQELIKDFINEAYDKLSEQQFICRECNAVVKLTDYDFKDGNLYYSLRDIHLCEDCARK